MARYLIYVYSIPFRETTSISRSRASGDVDLPKSRAYGRPIRKTCPEGSTRSQIADRISATLIAAPKDTQLRVVGVLTQELGLEVSNRGDSRSENEIADCSGMHT